jgi:hypothetical protein
LAWNWGKAKKRRGCRRLGFGLKRSEVVPHLSWFFERWALRTLTFCNSWKPSDSDTLPPLSLEARDESVCVVSNCRRSSAVF